VRDHDNNDPVFIKLPSQLYDKYGDPTDDVNEAATVVFIDDDGAHEHPWSPTRTTDEDSEVE
jgi:hypothetical protein